MLYAVGFLLGMGVGGVLTIGLVVLSVAIRSAREQRLRERIAGLREGADVDVVDPVWH